MGIFYCKPTAKFKKLRKDVKGRSSKKTYCRQSVNKPVRCCSNTVTSQLLKHIGNEPTKLFESLNKPKTFIIVCNGRNRSENQVHYITRNLTMASSDALVMQKYNFERVVGKGNFSRVIQVKDIISKADYAMKIVERKSCLSNTICDREFDILTQLHHRYIVHFYGAYKTDSNYYFLLELANGGNLAARLKNSGSFQEDYARDILSMILDALKYLHEQGIAHRDLKLENCLYKTEESDSIILLSDFGLAHFQPTGESTTNQGMQTTCGTEDYISPEMLDGDIYTNRVDMWALGIVMYAMLCGQMPFVDENRAKMYHKIKNGSYETSSESWLSVSSVAINFMSCLLCVNPMERLSAFVAQQHPWINNY